MASTYYDDAERFTFRKSTRQPEEYSNPAYEPEPDPSAKQLSAVTPSSFNRSIDGMMPHKEASTMRRIVV
ncbi:unnamed protein product, partial [Rotaria sp. Silwood1]